jgi:hypothetical protein
MIEKSYEKEVDLAVSQSVLTRLANRLVKDWCEVNETSTPSDEIKEVAKKSRIWKMLKMWTHTSLGLPIHIFTMAEEILTR